MILNDIKRVPPNALDSAICNFGDSPSRKEKRQQWHQKMMYFYLKGNLPEEAVNWLNPFD